MSDFLTLDGTAYAVVADGATEAERTYTGGRWRTFLGALRSTEQAPKRTMTFVLAPLTVSADAALDATVALGRRIVVGGVGPCPTGGTITCTGTLTREWDQGPDLVLRVRPTLTLREV